MDTLKTFGIGDELYTFEATRQVSLRDNFRDVVARTSRLPGLAGGYDEYGSQAAPEEIGNVQCVFWLEADTLVSMRSKLDALAAMESWGKKLLVKQPMGSAVERFCWARVNDIGLPMNVRDVPHQRIRIEVNFQVDNPMWQTLGTYSWMWGDGTEWDEGALWGGTPVSNTVTGTDNTFSITPAGNRILYPRVAIKIPAAQSAANIRVERILGGVVVDQIRYSGTLSAGDVLDVDCPKYRVLLNWTDGYNDLFSIHSAAWFRLRGGLANEIRVRMKNASDQATVIFKYHGAYNV